MKKLSMLLLSGVAALGVSLSAEAKLFGIYLSGTTGTPAPVITLNGDTFVNLPNLTAATLNASGIDVLWILNGNNGAPDAQVTGNAAAVAAFIATGHILSFHDRNVNQGGLSASTYIPGAAGVTFVNLFSSNIDIEPGYAGAPITGPGGVITNTNLDGGNFSNHGYALLSSLPGGAKAVLDNGNVNQVVDFYYGFGGGGVYYSTIPLDFYFLGNNPAAFRDIYARNEAAFQGSGLGLVTQVPEPISLSLMGIGLLGLAAARRRRAS